MTDGVKVAMIMSAATVLAPLWQPWLQRRFSRSDKIQADKEATTAAQVTANSQLMSQLLGMVESTRKETRDDLKMLQGRVKELEDEVERKDKIIERLQEDVVRLETENRQWQQKCVGLEEMIKDWKENGNGKHDARD